MELYHNKALNSKELEDINILFERFSDQVFYQASWKYPKNGSDTIITEEILLYFLNLFNLRSDTRLIYNIIIIFFIYFKLML